MKPDLEDMTNKKSTTEQKLFIIYEVKQEVVICGTRKEDVIKIDEKSLF